MSVTIDIKNFFLRYKNGSLDSKDIILLHKKEILSFDEKIKKEDYYKEIKENILIIYGYTFRLDDINQRLFYTFSEAINAVNMDNLMRNDDGVKLNSFVYIAVLKLILDEIDGIVDINFKNEAINEYKKLEEKKAKENKYHVYQY